MMESSNVSPSSGQNPLLISKERSEAPVTLTPPPEKMPSNPEDSAQIDFGALTPAIKFFKKHEIEIVVTTLVLVASVLHGQGKSIKESKEMALKSLENSELNTEDIKRIKKQVGMYDIPKGPGALEKLTDRLQELMDKATAKMHGAKMPKIYGKDQVYGDSEILSNYGSWRNEGIHPALSGDHIMKNLTSGAMVAGLGKLLSLGFDSLLAGEPAYRPIKTAVDALIQGSTTSIATGLSQEHDRDKRAWIGMGKGIAVALIASSILPVIVPALTTALGAVGTTMAVGAGAELYSHASDHSELLTKVNKKLMEIGKNVGIGSVEGYVLLTAVVATASALGVTTLTPAIVMAACGLTMGALQAVYEKVKMESHGGGDGQKAAYEGLMKGLIMGAVATMLPPGASRLIPNSETLMGVAGAVEHTTVNLAKDVKKFVTG
jgi:hypothetical protein